MGSSGAPATHHQPASFPGLWHHFWKCSLLVSFEYLLQPLRLFLAHSTTLVQTQPDLDDQGQPSNESPVNPFSPATYLTSYSHINLQTALYLLQDKKKNVLNSTTSEAPLNVRKHMYAMVFLCAPRCKFLPPQAHILSVSRTGQP